MCAVVRRRQTPIESNPAQITGFQVGINLESVLTRLHTNRGAVSAICAGSDVSFGKTVHLEGVSALGCPRFFSVCVCMYVCMYEDHTVDVLVFSGHGICTVQHELITTSNTKTNARLWC